MEKIKSALYCRVSTKQDEQTTSYELQQKYKNEMFDIVKIYGERASGRALYKRKVLRELLSDCGIEVTFTKEKQAVFALVDKEIDFNNIIVANTSRFGRNVIECKQMIEFLHKKNITVWFDDISKFSNASDIDMTLDILFLLDESVSRQTSKKVKVGLERAREEKQYLHPGSKMFGFAYDKKNNRFIHNEDSAIIKKIFNDYKNGDSIRKLSAKYDKTMSRIKDTLDNPRYCGYDRYNIYISGSNKRKNIDDVEIFQSDRIEPIISYDLWKECQEIKKSRKCGVRGVNNTTYPLSSKIICSECGTKFFHKQKNIRPNGDLWKCRLSHNEPHKCDMPSISEKTIIEWLNSRYGLKAIRFILQKRIQESISNIYIEDEEALKAKIKPLEERLKRKGIRYELGDIEEDEYLIERAEIKKELDRYKDRIEELEEKEKTIEELKYLKMNYDKILDNYSKLLEDNPQELLKKIEYVKVIKVEDEKKKNGYRAVVDEIFFSDFEPVKRFYGVKRPIDFK